MDFPLFLEEYADQGTAKPEQKGKEKKDKPEQKDKAKSAKGKGKGEENLGKAQAGTKRADKAEGGQSAATHKGSKGGKGNGKDSSKDLGAYKGPWSVPGEE